MRVSSKSLFANIDFLIAPKFGAILKLIFRFLFALW